MLAKPDSQRRLQNEWNQQFYKQESKRSGMSQNGMSHSTAWGMGDIR
jgi:hypothetical protein